MLFGTVLVVEDDNSIRRLLGAVLADAGLTVAEAPDGRSALPAARACAPDAVLLDVGLPGLDGLAVLDQLKADERLRDVPVVMVTAWTEAATVDAARARGAYDFVRKPFDVGELTDRVGDAVRHRAARAAGTTDVAAPEAPGGVDPLSGLPARAATRVELQHALERARRTRRPLATVMLELDVPPGSAPAADAALLGAVTRRLQARVRRDDVLGRWDERFLVVAPDTDLDGAGVLAEGLRWSLAQRPLATATGAARVTICAGAAEWDGDEPLDGLVRRCDAALAAARRVGRNTVRRAPAPRACAGLAA